MINGEDIYRLATELFPICRSLTGQGVRDTLAILKRELPELKVLEVESGSKYFDWTVPKEWNVRDAYIIDPRGEKIVDFKKSNLHVVGYSTTVDKELSLTELRAHLHTLPDMPDAIPYITSYYNEGYWGFCLPHEQLLKLTEGTYRVVIDSSHTQGHLTFGELLIPGSINKEIFLSTYICHPSMGNNELSGPCVTTYAAKWIKELPKQKFTYRIIFIPETIGSIIYIGQHLAHLKEHVYAGFNITCIGDDKAYSYLPTRNGQTISDRVILHVLKHLTPSFCRYTYLDRGSDERQYNSPGVDLPVASLMRTKYGAYPEYHTSKDDLTFISPQGLWGGFNALSKCLLCLEKNFHPKATMPCEPQMGKRGLYPLISTKESTGQVQAMMDLIAYSDGEHDLLSIAETINRPMWELLELALLLLEKGIISEG